MTFVKSVVVGMTGLLLAAAIAPESAAQEPSSPLGAIFDQLKAAGRSDKPFTLNLRVKVKPGTQTQMAEAARKAVPPTRAEAGCIAYEFHQELEDPTVFLLFEKWRDAAALENHFQQPHTKAALATIGEVAAEPPQIRVLAPVEGAAPTK